MLLKNWCAALAAKGLGEMKKFMGKIGATLAERGFWTGALRRLGIDAAIVVVMCLVILAAARFSPKFSDAVSTLLYRVSFKLEKISFEYHQLGALARARDLVERLEATKDYDYFLLLAKDCPVWPVLEGKDVDHWCSANLWEVRLTEEYLRKLEREAAKIKIEAEVTQLKAEITDGTEESIDDASLHISRALELLRKYDFSSEQFFETEYVMLPPPEYGYHRETGKVLAESQQALVDYLLPLKETAERMSHKSCAEGFLVLLRKCSADPECIRKEKYEFPFDGQVQAIRGHLERARKPLESIGGSEGEIERMREQWRKVLSTDGPIPDRG